MTEDYTKVYTESTILVKRLQTLLNEANIHSRIKSDKIPAYEITNFIDELFVLNNDVAKAQTIIDTYKEKINS